MTSHRTAGSIYDGFSPRGQHALATLRAEFQDAGFYAEKERRTERTLRVYPVRRWRYPLLNPGIVAARQNWIVPVTKVSIVCPVYSDGDDLISRLLASLPSITDCTYVAARPRRSGRYLLHGSFVVPITFSGERSGLTIDFRPVRPVLAHLQLQLSRADVPGSWKE